MIYLMSLFTYNQITNSLKHTWKFGCEYNSVHSFRRQSLNHDALSQPSFVKNWTTLIFIKEHEPTNASIMLADKIIIIGLSKQIITMFQDIKYSSGCFDLDSYSYSNFYSQQHSYPYHEFQQKLLHIGQSSQPIGQLGSSDSVQSENSKSIINSLEVECDDYDFYGQNQPQKIKDQTAHTHPQTNSQKHQTNKKCSSENKDKKNKKRKKNQYDKNIFSNISTVIIKKMLAPQSRTEIEHYCLAMNASFQEVYHFFHDIEKKRQRLGTSELTKLFSSNELKQEMKRVFGMFLVRYLREEYLGYAMWEGKMQDKGKYLKCATKMMYIPRLRKEEYTIISGLMNQAPDF